MRPTPKLIVFFWIFGFAGALIIQSVFQRWFGQENKWGFSPGWQTEIAFWNLGMIAVLIPSLKSQSAAKLVIPGLSLLSLLFGLNHLQAVVTAPFYLGHFLGAASNLIASGVGAVYLLTNKDRSE